MKLAEGLVPKHESVRWSKPVLILGGVVWIIRAGLEVVVQPAYWNPQTPVDYAAVAGTSIALFLLALGVWSIHRNRKPQGRLSKWIWYVGVILVCGGAIVTGFANFFEDWMGIKAFGTFYTLNIAVFVGLVLAGIGAIRATDVSRWTGWLLIACALGLGTPDTGGGFIVGTSLILLGVMQKG